MRKCSKWDLILPAMALLAPVSLWAKGMSYEAEVTKVERNDKQVVLHVRPTKLSDKKEVSVRLDSSEKLPGPGSTTVQAGDVETGDKVHVTFPCQSGGGGNQKLPPRVRVLHRAKPNEVATPPKKD